VRGSSAGSAFVRHQGLDMGGLLDLRAAVERARMGRDELQPIEDAHGIERGEHAQGALHVSVGNGVVVPVEARVGGFAHLHLQALLGRERILGQGEQVGFLLREERAHAARAIFGTGPIGASALTPGLGLSVQIVQIAEAARGEECLACESNRALDASLLVSPQMSAARPVKQ
jgi:hypothetical protein